MKFNFLNITKTVVVSIILLFSSFTIGMARYDTISQEKVKRALGEMKRGELRSGKSNKIVTSRKQAIAIGLSEARKEGAKVPKASR